jgi:epoxyqueuosine reductase
MMVRSIIEHLKQEALLHGDKISAISASMLPEVKKNFDKLGIETHPYFDFAPSSGLEWPLQSVLVAASPSRRFSVSFDMGNREFKAIIPAAYADDEKKNCEIEQYLKVLLENEGYHILQGKKLPLKALAANTGLGVYGRNNLIYIEGFGSFLNLNVFFTDLPVQDEPFFPFEVLDTCKDCNLCVKDCPSGALREEPFFVEITRCLTWANESDEPFPDWVESSWHNALIGCERCQLVCPHNRELLNPIEEIARYNIKETEAFLRDELPKEALEPLGVAHYCKCLGRNLKSLLAAQTVL